MRTALLCSVLFWASLSKGTGQEIIIQENEIGFCSVDGVIATSVAGYTGTGYADSDPGIGKSISWQFSAGTAGTYALVWRYGLGGNPGDRNARLLINGNVMVDTVYFPHTGTWTNWTLSAPMPLSLAPGSYKIRIEAYSTSGLGNYDYLAISGPAPAPDSCTPSYVVQVAANAPERGAVSYEPVQPYYDRGTLVTLHAHANPGYFFQSWTGRETSADTAFTFAVRGNVNAIARFLPEGTTMEADIMGYATVQDDAGTPYLVTGGVPGDTVHASSVADLQTSLGDPQPRIVLFTGELTGTDVISITSDKTLLGIGTAHLRGIELSINQARNIIIRNITISHVTPQDAIEINGASKNILIDHCEFYSDRDHGTDYYDGLLDIKNESSFITVSWSSFHDHYKVCLISSGDEQVADTVTRVTFHHNYFYNCESRLPSIRFGRAHIFNNYYRDSHTAINARMGACVRVERNYFDSVGTAVMSDFSTLPGSAEILDNHFGTSGVTITQSCALEVPYTYAQVLDPVDSIPAIVTRSVPVTAVTEQPTLPQVYSLRNYPNPFNPTTVVEFVAGEDGSASLTLFTILGEEVATLFNDRVRAGDVHRVMVNGSELAAGVYVARLVANNHFLAHKIVLLR